MYEDKPFIARGWESETASDTAREVRVTFNAMGFIVYSSPAPNVWLRSLGKPPFLRRLPGSCRTALYLAVGSALVVVPLGGVRQLAGVARR